MPYPGELLKDMLGIRVERAAATLPQTAQAPLFTLTGDVLVTALIGEVTTVMGATANNLSIVANPTVGADLAISAVVATANDAVGVHYALPGAFATALVKGVALPVPANAILVPAGTIDLLASGSNTGAARWTLYFIPVDASVRVTAA